MRTLRRNRALSVILVGGIVMAASVFFEYARMAPDYRFIVEPWSLRGYETTQGWVLFTIALSVLVLATVVGFGLVKENLIGAGTLAVVATVIAVVLAVVADPRDIELAGLGLWGLSLIGGAAAAAALSQALPDSIEGATRTLIVLGTGLVALIVLALAILGPIFEGSQPLWLVVVIGFVLMGAGVLLRKPRELASYRLVINTAVVALVVAATIGGSVRTALMEAQTEAIGVAAEYLDTQVTSGIILTWIGSTLMILGAVAMWAKRRDHLDAIERARRQRAAAIKSAEELGVEAETRV